MKLWKTWVVVGVAFGLGLAIRPSGIHEPPSPPEESSSVPTATPDPEMLAEGHTAAAGKYIAVAESCRTPGHGKVAYCWWGGWNFARKTVCVATNVPGAPIADVLKKYNGVAGIRMVNGGTSCGKRGYPASQSINIQLYTAADKRGSMKGACAYTAPSNYGNVNSMLIRVNVTAYRKTACSAKSADQEWYDVFTHEVGHAFGFTHEQPGVRSIMRDSNGRGLDTSDKSELTVIYGKRRI